MDIGVPLKINGAPGTIQGSLTGMQWFGESIQDYNKYYLQLK